MKNLDELQALCDAATPGPWDEAYTLDGYLGTEGCNVEIRWQIRDDDPDGWDNGHRRANAAFIAAARTELPRLIDEMKKWRTAAVDGCAALGMVLPVVDGVKVMRARMRGMATEIALLRNQASETIRHGISEKWTADEILTELFADPDGGE